MMNLKSLKCLSAKPGRKLSIEQCNMSNYQKWDCTEKTVKNRKIAGNSWKWIVPGNSTYFENCNQAINSYKGSVKAYLQILLRLK